MSALQDFMNLILKNPNPNATRSSGPIQTEMKNAGYTQGNTVSKIGQNAARNAGNLMQFANDVINPLSSNNLLNVAVTHPNDLGKKVTQDISGIGQGVNNMVGQPVNPQTGQLQTPDVGKAVLSATENPISTALAFTGPKGLPKLGAKVAESTEAAAPVAEGATRVTVKPSYYGASKEAAVQKTVNDVVPGDTATEKYANLEPTMTKLGADIQNKLAANPQDIPLSRVKSDLMTNLEDQIMSKNLSSKTAQSEVDGYLRDLGAKSNQHNIPEGQVESTVNKPETINSTDLFSLKQKVNDQYQGVKKKIDNGTQLNPREQVIAVARQTFDDVVSDYHKDVKDLTTQQSHLYDAAPSLYKGREAEISDAAKAAEKESNRDYSQQILGTKIPGRVAKPFVQKAEGLANNAEGKVAGASARLAPLGGSVVRGLPPIGGIQAIANNISGEPENGPGNNESNHDQSVSQTYSDVNSGRYAALAPQGQLSTDQYTAQQNKYINDIAGAKASGNTIAAQTLQGNLDSLNNSWNNASGVRDEAVKLNKTLLVGNAAARAIDAADPGLLSLNGSFDKLLNSSNRNYAALGSALQKLQQDTGVNISGAKTKEALVGALDQAMQVERTNYNALLQQQTGAPASQNKPAGIQALPTQAPQSNIGQPVHYDFNFGASGEHMPQ